MTPRRLPPLPAVLSWTTLLGVGAAVTGLAWDAVLHARDPLLAQHEGVLTATNPAHVLLAGGVLLALLAQIGFMSLRLSAAARRRFTTGVALFAIAVAATIGWSEQVSAGQQAAAQRLVSATRASLLTYRSVSAAIQAGYEPVTPLNWPIVEWVNPVYMKAGRVLDLQRPERLMYISAPGGLMLAGAMFVLPQGIESPPAGVAGLLAHWHRHGDLCYLRNGTVVGTNGYGAPCPAGSIAHLTPPMLHIWIVPNPEGPFADDMTPAAIAKLVAHE